MENLGVKEPQIRPTDWKASGLTGIKYEDRGVKWADYLPTKERQAPPETFSCVTFSLLNSIETQLNYLLAIGKITAIDADPFLDSNGLFNLSDRWLAIKSGTDREGNDLQVVLDTIRKYGCPSEKDLPFGGSTFDEYHNKKLLTPELDKKALKLLDLVDITYQWLWSPSDKNIRPIIEYYIKQYPIQVAGTICQPWDVPNVATCPIRVFQHATIIYGTIGDRILNLDQYDPFLKTMDFNYPFLCGLGVLVSPKAIIHPVDQFHIDHPELSPDVTPEQYTFRQNLFNFFKKMFGIKS